MDCQQNNRTVALRKDGVTLVRGVFRFPSTKAWNLYSELAQNAEEWLRSSLLPKASEEYLSDSSPKKQFFFSSYDYLFEVQTIFQKENEITFALTVTLSRQKSKELLFQKEFIDRFRLPDLLILPPKRKPHHR